MSTLPSTVTRTVTSISFAASEDPLKQTMSLERVDRSGFICQMSGKNADFDVLL